MLLAPLSSSAAARVKGSLTSRLESPYTLIALAISSSVARKQVQPPMQATVPHSFDSGNALISVTDVIASRPSTLAQYRVSTRLVSAIADLTRSNRIRFTLSGIA